MQGVAVLIAVLWIAANPWVLAVMALLALALVALFVWDATKGGLTIGGLSCPPIGPSKKALVARIGDLNAALQSAREEIETLRQQNCNLQRQVRSEREVEERSRDMFLFRRVGLHPDVPAWLIPAVQRAYRAKLHPDRYPPRLKETAEKRFKEAEAVFGQIAAERARAAA